MNDEIILIISLSLLILVTPFLSKIVRLPSAVLEIIFGSVATTIGLIYHNELFKTIAEFGFLYLMFLAGLEIDLKKVFGIGKILVRKTFFYIFFLYASSLFFVKMFGFSNIFIVIFPLVSVGLIAALKKAYPKDLKWLDLSLKVASLGEVVSIGALSFVSAALHFGWGIKFYETIFYLIFSFVLFLIIYKMLNILFWWFPEIKTSLMPKIDKEEQDIRLSIALLFVLLALMIYLGLELAFGAFVAGILIATFFEHKKSLPKKLSSFGFGFFVPIFFIYTGSSFEIKSLFMEGLIIKSLMIVSFMFAIRIIASLVFFKELGIKGVFLFALSHSMPLTLLVAIATLAFYAKSIDNFHYLAFVLASIIEVILCMSIIRAFQKSL
jgi:Kef-type K+ transport system membrane component KefB